jgi:hypothetical protein
MSEEEPSFGTTGPEAEAGFINKGYPNDTDANKQVQQQQQQQQEEEEEEEVDKDEKDYQHDEKILSRLYHATRSNNDSLLQRTEYQRRLLSFHPSTYYAKPACLSPLFCASFG